MRAAVAVLLLLAAGALAAPWIAQALGQDPFLPDLLDRFAPPSAAHPLGTDELGRDVLVRLLYGARVSLAVGITAALAAAVLGTAIGILAAMAGGIVDALLMRLADGLLALPALPLLVVLAAVDPTRLGLPRDAPAVDLLRIVVIIALFGWVTVARLARAATLSLLEHDFVRAATALGATPWDIARRHLAPNLVAPISVAAALSVGHTILVESVLSFLGLGIQPPMPSWGNMLANAQEMVFAAPLQAVWPGVAIFATVVSCNVLGERLQRRA